MKTLLRTRHATLKIMSLTLLVAAVSTGVAVYFTLLADLPAISQIDERITRPTSQILDRNGLLLYEVIDPQAGRQLDLTLDEIPLACVQATLATEDERYYLHPGVDPLAVARAALQYLDAGGQVVSGASTITQQVARNLLMDADERYEQSLQRKLREAWLALQLEVRYSKGDLLALYLNQTYFGNWAFGIEAAAQTFFAKPARQLSRGECALLAGLIQYPTGYNPLLEPDTAKARQLTVLRLMTESQFLTREEADLVAAEPLHYKSNLFQIEAPHFVMYIQSKLVDSLGVERLREGGLRVVTTLDLTLQHEAEASVRRRLDQLNCRAPGICDETTDPNRRVDNAAAVVLDSASGDILAMVGSPDYFDPRIQGNVNAALSLRQPGSAIKPLTYAAALDPRWSGQAGVTPLTPASLIADLPTTFFVADEDGGHVPYAPLNYDRSYHGPVSLRTALASSYNIPAVKTLDRLGVDTLRSIAGQAGIHTFDRNYGLALTLGGGEVKLLELAASYGILDDGVRLEPRGILGIKESSESNATISPSFGSYSVDRVLTPQTAFLMTDILSDAAARAPAFGQSSVLDLPFEAAVKTGTTTDWRDNWTVGYSTERIVGVWVGNADNAPMLDVSGIDGAGPIWRDIMLAAHPHFPRGFAEPAGIVRVPICAASGMLPSPACPRVRTELFAAGTAPNRIDDQFVRLAVDRETGLVADHLAPLQQIEERTFRQLPAEYHEWMVSQGNPIVPPEVSTGKLTSQTHARVGAVGRAGETGNALVLTSPTSHTAYQIYPGVPRDRQKLKISGFGDDGRSWAVLRLVKDGEVLTQLEDASRITTWWPLEPGTHHFYLEGEATQDADIWRSEEALVIVDEPSALARSADP